VSQFGAKMVRVKYLWRHPKSGTWHYRRALPEDVRIRLGKVILVNLRTRDETEAIKRVLPLIEKTNREIAEVRSGRKLGEDELGRISLEWNRYYEESIVMGRRATLPDEIQVPVSTEAELDESVLRFLALTDYEIPSIGPDFARLRELCFEHHYHAYAVQPPLTRLTKPGRDFIPLHFGSSPLLLSELLKAYNGERKTIADRTVAVARFIDLLGDKVVTQISRADVRQFRSLVGHIPTAMPKIVRCKSVRQQIEWGKANSANLANPASVNKQLSMISSLLEWARNDGGLLDDFPEFQNPFSGLHAQDDRHQEEKRIPFTVHDLNVIFATEWFRVANDEDRWLPLLALFTGARLEELGQLLLTDIRREDGVDFLAITTLDDKGDKVKSVKNPESRRNVPLHPRLTKLGFLKYVEAQRGAGRERLFPALRVNSKGKLTQAYSHRINRRIRKLVPDKRKVFHSLRHNFKNEATRVLLPEPIVNALQGHSGGTVALDVYGQGAKTLFQMLYKQIGKLKFPGLQVG